MRMSNCQHSDSGVNLLTTDLQGMSKMARNVFFSFHFGNDYWRTNQIRQMGSLQGQAVCRPNEWEEVKRKGAASIEAWIDENMKGKSCVVVLVGSETALRPWVLKEIVKGWNGGKGVLGIRIDKLLDSENKPSRPGQNPFDMIDCGAGKLSNRVDLITPQGFDSKAVYADIHANMERWIETAIRKRNA